jgi:hypothetical protein
MGSCQGAGGTGTQYSYAQLEGLWIQAGGPSAAAPVAAAIALAESGGCTSAMNFTDNGGTQTSVGLWQVSTGTHQYPASWTSAGGNAAEAVAKYNAAGGFSPWGTYDSGAYRGFLNGSTTPDLNVPGGGGGTGPATLTGYTAATNPDCLWQFPGILGVGSFCFITRHAVRHLVGGLLMLTAAIPAGLGVVLLGAFAFRASGAANAAANIASAVPGGGPAAVGLRAVGRQSRSARSPSSAPPAAGAAAAAPPPTQDEIRAMLAARGNQLAPQVPAG